jgi:hypothetical protein
MTKREQAKAMFNGYFGAAGKSKQTLQREFEKEKQAFSCPVGSVCIFSSVRQEGGRFSFYLTLPLLENRNAE